MRFNESEFPPTKLEVQSGLKIVRNRLLFSTEHDTVNDMKTVSIDELKRNLASLVAAAAGGERILITRHRRPVASLSRANLEYVHVGALAGRASLKPLLRAATRGAYLEVLAEDRRPAGRRDR